MTSYYQMFQAERDRLSDRHQPTTFTFLQIKPNEMNNISMLRFQEQRLVIQLQAKDNSFGFAIVTNQNHRMTTIQKIVEASDSCLSQTVMISTFLGMLQLFIFWFLGRGRSFRRQTAQGRYTGVH